MNIQTGRYLDGRKDHCIVDDNNPMEEVFKVHYRFFQKPYHKQRAALRLLIWWSVKHYLKILFK